MRVNQTLISYERGTHSRLGVNLNNRLYKTGLLASTRSKTLKPKDTMISSLIETPPPKKTLVTIISHSFYESPECPALLDTTYG